MKIVDLEGETIGLWTVIKRVDGPETKSKSKPAYWKCQCKCGNTAIIASHNLRAKNSLSCGCRIKLPEYKALFNRFVWISKNRGIECSLSFDDFRKFTKTKSCHYCHSQIKWKPRGKSQAYHLDRKDTSIGYTKSNCVVCCNRCNWGKSVRYTYNEWYEMNRCFRERNPNS